MSNPVPTVRLEFSGHRALFTDPTSGSHPRSYPWATPTALRGIADNIRLFHAVRFVPRELRVCRRIRYDNWAFNYKGPLRSTSGDDAQMIKASTLIDVCYQVEYELHHNIHGGRSHAEYLGTANDLAGGRWNRIVNEGSYRMPVCLGHRELAPDYVGEWRPESQPIPAYEFHQNFLLSMWDKQWGGKAKPRFGDSMMENGIVRFPRL